MIEETPLRIYRTFHCEIREYRNGIVHTFWEEDDSMCVFAPPMENGEVQKSFQNNANEMGYSDPFRYAVEHEIAHHIVAQYRKGNTYYSKSLIVWDASHNVKMSLDEPERSLEEHLVNSFQKFVNYGTYDEYGMLQEHMDAKLPEASLQFLNIARPWLCLPI